MLKNINKGLTVDQIKKLVSAATVKKVANTKYDTLKDEYVTDDIDDGKYIAEGVGCVAVATVEKEITDTKKMCKEHPEVEELMKQYKKKSVYRTVSCENYAVTEGEDESKKKILGLF